VGAKVEAPLKSEVVFLVLNGFLNMYAFGTETIYAMFIKDTFGYGEKALSGLFALNGLVMGVFQVFAIKPLINLIGKHATLALGNLLLGAGMLGLALIRAKAKHFFFFAVHILGYSIADTALVSLVSRYSDPSSQGRDLALNQAAQACARIFSPLVAGLLYERSKQMNAIGQALLPTGALPFLVGGMCPAVAVLVPTLLYVKNKAMKSRQAQLVERLAAESAANGNGNGKNGGQGGHDRWNNNNA
jgi:Na+/melibiose symporter-like transporter